MPFWREALETELIATKRIRLMVEAESDRIVRDAIAMQAYEENRHAELFASLMRHYAIVLPDPDSYQPRDPQWGFMRMGYGEVFDILFAFGLFKLAAETGFFPDSLTQIFEKLIAKKRATSSSSPIGRCTAPPMRACWPSPGSASAAPRRSRCRRLAERIRRCG